MKGWRTPYQDRENEFLYMSLRAWEKVRPWFCGGGWPSDPNILSAPATDKRGWKWMILREQEVKCVVNNLYLMNQKREHQIKLLFDLMIYAP